MHKVSAVLCRRVFVPTLAAPAAGQWCCVVLRPPNYPGGGRPAAGQLSATPCREMRGQHGGSARNTDREVPFHCLAQYIRTEINGTSDDVERDVIERASILGYASPDLNLLMSRADAELIAEDIGANPEDLDSFLAHASALSEDPAQAMEAQASDGAKRDDDISEYDTYKTSEDIIRLARERGAQVCAKGALTHIKTVNGVNVSLTTRNNDWMRYTSRGGASDRTRTLQQLKRGGVRAAVSDSGPHRY